MLAIEAPRLAGWADQRPASARYVLITAARNEQVFIETTIRTVLRQTVLPIRWIIASDGSTDRTNGIVQRYAADHPWIELLCMPLRNDRQFAAKANCFNAAYANLAEERFDFVANLDADISVPPDYFAFLLAKFRAAPLLGVAGTPYVSRQRRASRQGTTNEAAEYENVPGACQIFRRECYEAIGGYRPVKAGAIDRIAVTTARMKGWQTRMFAERVCIHERPLGDGQSGTWAMPFQRGRQAYLIGSHPAWATYCCAVRMIQRPWLIGSLLYGCGYTWAALTGTAREVSPELMTFYQGEQLARMKAMIVGSRRAAYCP